jgi:hypothetical protein
MQNADFAILPVFCRFHGVLIVNKRSYYLIFWLKIGTSEIYVKTQRTHFTYFTTHFLKMTQKTNIFCIQSCVVSLKYLVCQIFKVNLPFKKKLSFIKTM